MHDPLEIDTKLAMNAEMNEARDHAEVMEAFNNLAAAATSLDHERYFSAFDKKQFTSLNHAGTVFHDFTSFETDFQKQVQAIEKYNNLKFRNIKICSIAQNVCVLINEYVAEVQLKNGDVVLASGAGAQVWQKCSGMWLLTHISSSLRS